MITNLDILKKYYPQARFELLDRDVYMLNQSWTIVWTGEGEVFTVDYNYYDHDVGYVTDDQLVSGDLIECLNFCLKEDGRDLSSDEDRQEYIKIVNEDY